MFLIVLELLTILVLVILRNRQNFQKVDAKTELFENFMEPEIRANPWIGILQEDVYKDPSGPIGKFTGKIVDTSTPVYEITSD